MANMGRPKSEVRMDLVDAACQFNATANQVLEVLRQAGHEVSLSTLQREIKNLHDLTFDQYRDQKMETTRLKLAQKAVTLGLGGNVTMLIFCLKNLCGWKDRQSHELTGENGGPIAMTTDAPPAQVLVVLPPNGREKK